MWPEYGCGEGLFGWVLGWRPGWRGSDLARFIELMGVCRDVRLLLAQEGVRRRGRLELGLQGSRCITIAGMDWASQTQPRLYLAHRARMPSLQLRVPP